MMNENKSRKEFPKVEELRQELERVKLRRKYRRILRDTVFTLITVSAVAVLISTLLLPVLRIYGTSMSPTLSDGNIVVSVKTHEYKTGDVIAFYYNNKILVKRVIAKSGDWINIDKKGTVYVNGEEIDEPYLKEKAFGECDIQLPYQVPEERVFVMGDNRDVSIDSRSKAIGCVAEEQVVGIISFCLWPYKEIGKV